MYSKIAEDEDNKTAGRWQREADGILIFVSPCVHSMHTNWNSVDWFIFCFGRRTALRVYPGSEA